MNIILEPSILEVDKSEISMCQNWGNTSYFIFFIWKEML